MTKARKNEQEEETSTFFKGDTNVSGEIYFTKLCPELARRIGIPMALVLQHIYFRLSVAEPSEDGSRWAQIPTMDFTKRLPLCKKAIRNAVDDLKKNEFIFVPTMEELKKAKRNISGGIWYSINEGRVIEEMSKTGKKLKRKKRSKNRKANKHA